MSGVELMMNKSNDPHFAGGRYNFSCEEAAKDVCKSAGVAHDE